MSSIDRYKRGFFFSPEFVGDHSWNGYENNLMFESLEVGQFADMARPLGCDEILDSRGVAVADLNDDGRLDLVINNNHAPPTIYLNRVSGAGSWLRLLAVAGPDANRDGIGTRVRVTVDVDGSPRTITRWVEAGTGYASQSDLRLHFGLGAAERIEALVVTWPDGQEQSFDRGQLAGVLNQSIQIVQGKPQIMTPATPQVTSVAQQAGGGE